MAPVTTAEPQLPVRPSRPRNMALQFWLVGAATTLSVLSFVSAITFVCASAAFLGAIDNGAIAWLVLSFTASLGGAAALLYLVKKKQQQQTPPDAEAGIELAKMPTRPKRNKAIATHPRMLAEDRFWHQFAKDGDQVRHYVERLEDRLSLAEQMLDQELEDQLFPKTYPPRVVKQGPDMAMRPLHVNHTIQHQHETAATAAATATADKGKRGWPMPETGLDDSILTQLCAAVTQPCSPFANEGESSHHIAAQRSSYTEAPLEDIISGQAA